MKNDSLITTKYLKSDSGHNPNYKNSPYVLAQFIYFRISIVRYSLVAVINTGWELLASISQKSQPVKSPMYNF